MSIGEFSPTICWFPCTPALTACVYPKSSCVYVRGCSWIRVRRAGGGQRYLFRRTAFVAASSRVSGADELCCRPYAAWPHMRGPPSAHTCPVNQWSAKAFAAGMAVVGLPARHLLPAGNIPSWFGFGRGLLLIDIGTQHHHASIYKFSSWLAVSPASCIGVVAVHANVICCCALLIR